MEPQSHNNAIISWLIAFGVLLILGVGGAAYFFSAPNAPTVISGGTSSTAQDASGSHASGTGSSSKDHYANLFYEFDHPDNFVVTHEEVMSDHNSDATSTNRFGVTKVILDEVKEGGARGYEITVISAPNNGQTPPAALLAAAKEQFNNDPNHGLNDAFQAVEIDRNAGYEEYAATEIFVGIPTGNLIHQIRISWDPGIGNVSEADKYISVITDSYLFK